MRRWHSPRERVIMLRRWRLEIAKHEDDPFGSAPLPPVAEGGACHCYRGMGFLRKRKPYDCGNPRCGICHFDVLVDPLLKRIAAKEATAAEMVVIAALQGKSLPNTVKDWATRWISIKTNVPSALASILVGEEWTACCSPFVPLRYESLGRFDKMDLFTIGCGEGTGMALKTELRCALAGRSKEAAEMVPESTLLGEAARGKECLRRSAPAFSGWPQSALCIDTSQSKIL